jgi:hypothetical protein
LDARRIVGSGHLAVQFHPFALRGIRFVPQSDSHIWHSLFKTLSPIEMSQKKIAEILIETLVAAGVKRVFGVVGDSLNGILEDIGKRKDIQWIPMRHEETGAFAAGAQAHLTGELAVCAGSCGPGNLHLINGLYDCHRSRVPVLAIAANYVAGPGVLNARAKNAATARKANAMKRPRGSRPGISFFRSVPIHAFILPLIFQHRWITASRFPLRRPNEQERAT